MTVLAGKDLEKACQSIFRPFVAKKSTAFGLSYGLDKAGYDVRLKQTLWLPPHSMRLGSTLEYFNIPNYLRAQIQDKSTNIRKAIKVGNSTAEPGWCGHLTVEIFNHSWWFKRLPSGYPIANITFDLLSEEVEPYAGKYQDQADMPVAAILEAT